MNEAPQSKPIRVLLVEDEPLWQTAIGDLLRSNSRFALVAVAEDFDSALKAFQENLPQLVLLDWKIRGVQDGLAVGQALLQAGLPPEQIILISNVSNSAIPPHPFLRVPKNRIPEDLLPLMLNVTSH